MSKTAFLLHDETVLKSSRAGHQTDIRTIRGKLYLTDRRVIFVPTFLQTTARIISTPLSEVLGVELAWGLFMGHVPLIPTAILIYLKDGSFIRLVVYNREEWGKAILSQTSASSEKSHQRLNVTCDSCGRKLKVNSDAAGKSGRCPFCKELVRVPLLQQPSPTPSPTEPAAARRIAPAIQPNEPRASSSLEDYDSGLLFPLYFPFTRPGWFQSLWWVCLLMFVPVVNVLLLRGWRLELTSRIAAKKENVFPSASGIPKYLLKGAVLWFFTFTFTLVPMIVIASLGVGGIVDTLGDIWTFLQIVTWQSETTLVSFLVGEGIEEVICFLIAGFWGIVSSPLYRAGMIRHSVTGKMRSFWNLPASVRFIATYPWDFLALYTVSVVSWAVALFLASLLISTGVGAIVAVAVLPLMYFWSTGFEYGKLGAKLC